VLQQKRVVGEDGVERGIGFFWKISPAKARRNAAPSVAQLRAEIQAVYGSTRQGRALHRIASMKLRAEALDVEATIREGREAFRLLGLT
jgi:hypothetical protein